MELIYDSLPCKEIIEVSGLVSVQYTELPKDFTFHPECHRCWEINFVDRGSVLLYVDGEEITLNKNQLIIYEPMIAHGILKKTEDAPDTCTIAFESDSEALYRLSGRMINVSAGIQKLLSRVMEYAYKLSDTGIEVNKLEKFKNQNDTDGMILALIFISIKEMLLHMLLDDENDMGMRKTTVENEANENYRRVVDYITARLDQRLSLDEISTYFFTSKSKLYHDVKIASGLSVQELVTREKLTTAKRMVREEQLNFTEISKALGFSSLHYFSAWFKNKTRMSPTEYASSVKARGKL